MELSKQEIELFLPLPGLWSKNFFYKMLLIITKESKIDFQNRKWNYLNRKWNYLNRKWNYFSHFHVSDQKTSFTTSSPYLPRNSKSIFKPALELFGSIRIFLDLFDPVPTYLELFTSIWTLWQILNSFESFGSIWIHLGQLKLCRLYRILLIQTCIIFPIFPPYTSPPNCVSSAFIPFQWQTSISNIYYAYSKTYLF